MIKRIGLLGGAGVAAQSVNLLLMPVVATLYGPAVYGEFSQFFAAMQIAIPVAALCLPLAIVPADNDKTASQLTTLAIISATLTSTMLVVATLIWNHVGESGTSSFSAFSSLGLVCVFAAVQQTSYQWLVRYESLVALAVVPIAGAIIMNALRLSGGYLLNASYTVLVGATVSGYILHGIITFILARRNTPVRPPCKLSATTAVTLSKSTHTFTLYRTPQVLINALGKNAPVFAFSLIYTPSITGEFALALALMAAPTMLIGNAFSSVYYPRITASVYKSEGSRKLLREGQVTLGLLAIATFGPVIAFADDAVALFMGSAWYNVGVLAPLMSPWFAASLVSKAAIDAIPALKVQKQFLAFETLSTMIRLATLGYCALVQVSPVSAVTIFSLVSALCYLSLSGWIMIACARNDIQRST